MNIYRLVIEGMIAKLFNIKGQLVYEFYKSPVIDVHSDKDWNCFYPATDCKPYHPRQEAFPNLINLKSFCEKIASNNKAGLMVLGDGDWNES